MHPRSIFSMLYKPGRKLALFSVELPPGSSIRDMINILELLESRNVAIIRSVYHDEYVQGVKKNFLCLACDLTSSSAPLEEVASLIGRSPNVKGVEVVRPTAPGFIVDEDHYPVVVVDERALIFRKEMMNIMLLGIREKWGATGQVFLYFLGYEGGVGAAKFYKRVSELPPVGGG